MEKCVVLRQSSNEEVTLKKVMLLAAMLAMVLAAAVPALAQSVTQVGQGNVACVQTAVNSEVDKEQVAVSQYGDAININTQAIAQECNIAVEQVNTAVNSFNGFEVNNAGDVIVVGTATASASASAAPAVQYEAEHHGAAAVQYEYSSPSATASASASASAAPAAAAELPDTGGSSLIALGAGVLLVAGGLLARRIVR